MTNPLPRQLYIARIALKCGAVTDIVTPMTLLEIRTALAEHPATIQGHNVEKNWPVNILVYDEVVSVIHAPHEQWLGARPNLTVQ